MGKGRRTKAANRAATAPSALPSSPQAPSERPLASASASVSASVSASASTSSPAVVPAATLSSPGTTPAGQPSHLHGSVPAQVVTVLEELSGLTVTAPAPRWVCGNLRSAVDALNAGRVSQRQLLAYLPRLIGDLACFGLWSCGRPPPGLAPGTVDSGGPSAEADPHTMLRANVVWLGCLLGAMGPSDGGQALNARARRKAVAWLVQHNHHKVLAALVLTPEAAASADLAQLCLITLRSLCYHANIAVGLCSQNSWTENWNVAAWRAMHNDAFTVSALLCWLTRVHSQPPSDTKGMAEDVVYRALVATDDRKEALRIMMHVPWFVYSEPGGSIDWPGFDTANNGIHVSVDYANRYYHTWFVHVVKMDLHLPAVAKMLLRFAAHVELTRTGGSHASAAGYSDTAEIARIAAAHRSAQQAAASEARLSAGGVAAPTAAAAPANVARQPGAGRSLQPGAGCSAAAPDGQPAGGPSAQPDGRAVAAAAGAPGTALGATPDDCGGSATAAAGTSAAISCAPAALPAEAQSAACAACGVSRQEARLKACAGCRVVRYCSAGCQKADWRIHKHVCQPLVAASP